MVAITVILAAVIGTFVLGLGDQVQQTSPNAQWNWYATASSTLDDQALSVTHEGGDSVAPGNLEVTLGSVSDICNEDESTGSGEGVWSGTDEEVTAGDTCTIESSTDTDSGSNNYKGGETARLIWTADGGGQSSTLSTYDVASP